MCKIILLSLLSSIGFATEPLSLFNGKDLSQWESTGTAVWRAENGVLVGGQDGDPKRSGLLRTRQSFDNFDLELEFFLDEHGKYNSGVYIRDTGKSKPYQVNIGRGAAGEYVGLYSDRWLDKGDEKDEIRKPNEWNHLRIRAVGASIEVWLNKKQIVRFTQEGPTVKQLAAGSISLQTYGAEGHAGWVKFRNITVKELGKD